MYSIRRLHPGKSTHTLYHILANDEPVGLLFCMSNKPMANDDVKGNFRLINLKTSENITEILGTKSLRTAQEHLDILNAKNIDIAATKLAANSYYVRYLTAYGLTYYYRNAAINMGYADCVTHLKNATTFEMLDTSLRHEGQNISDPRLNPESDHIVRIDLVNADTHEVVRSDKVELKHPVYLDEEYAHLIHGNPEMKAIHDAAFAANANGGTKLNPFRDDVLHFRAYELGWAKAGKQL
jgi:hypothetical protein